MSRKYISLTDRYHEDLKAIIGLEKLEIIHDEMNRKYGTGRHNENEFDATLKQSIEKVIKDVKNEKKERMEAIIELLCLSRGKSQIIKKIIKCIANYIVKLQNQEIVSEIKETELCHRTSTTNHEAKETAAKGFITSQRPDSCITAINNLFFGSSLGYVEVKPESEKGNQYSVSKDLVRLGLLSKNSLDVSGLQACFGVQAIDKKVDFFPNKLEADGLYIFTEIGNITIPSCIQNLGAFMSQLDDLAAVLKCYKEWCVPVTPNETSIMYLKRRPSLNDEQFSIISSSRSNKRRTVTMP